jgi:hypothetical protein
MQTPQELVDDPMFPWGLDLRVKHLEPPVVPEPPRHGPVAGAVERAILSIGGVGWLHTARRGMEERTSTGGSCRDRWAPCSCAVRPSCSGSRCCLRCPEDVREQAHQAVAAARRAVRAG